MRVRLIILSAVCAFFLLPLAAHAQMPGLPFSVYAGGGISIPTNPDEYKDSANTGFNAMGGVGFSVAPAIELVGKAELHQFGLEEFPDVTDGGNFTTLLIGADARFALGAPVIKIKPFLFVGAGFASVERSDPTFAPGSAPDDPALLFDQQDEVYYNFGGGLEFEGFAMFDFFVQARYVSISTQPEAMTYIPVTVGVKVF